MKAAIYARVSTADQDASRQISELKEIIKNRGWSEAGIYEDKGVSGGATSWSKRLALKRLMNDCKLGKVQVVMFWDVTRAGRSLVDTLRLLESIASCNVQIYIRSLGDRVIDTNSQQDKLFLQMMSMFAEMQRDFIRSATKSGLANARRQGKVLGRKRKVDGISGRAKVLRDEGKSFTEIGAELGVSTMTAHRAVMLNNEASITTA